MAHQPNTSWPHHGSCPSRSPKRPIRASRQRNSSPESQSKASGQPLDLAVDSTRRPPRARCVPNADTSIRPRTHAPDTRSCETEQKGCTDTSMQPFLRVIHQSLSADGNSLKPPLPCYSGNTFRDRGDRERDPIRPPSRTILYVHTRDKGRSPCAVAREGPLKHVGWTGTRSGSRQWVSEAAVTWTLRTPCERPMLIIPRAAGR